MKPKQKSALEQGSGPTLVRTSEVVPTSGTWRITCERPGCCAIDDVNLAEGARCPPCIRCCNPTILRFLSAPAVAAPQEPAAAPPAAAQASEPIVEAPMPFFDSVTLTPKKVEPLEETPAPAPDEKEKIEAPPAEPSLFEKLGGKTVPKKV
jgi:hypothetical protein